MGGSAQLHEGRMGVRGQEMRGNTKQQRWVVKNGEVSSGDEVLEARIQTKH